MSISLFGYNQLGNTTKLLLCSLVGLVEFRAHQNSDESSTAFAPTSVRVFAAFQQSFNRVFQRSSSVFCRAFKRFNCAKTELDPLDYYNAVMCDPVYEITLPEVKPSSATNHANLASGRSLSNF